MFFSARMTSAAPRRSLRPQSRRFLRVTSRRRQRRRATPWNAWRSCKVPWERFKNHGENHGNIWKNNGKTMETYGKPWNMWNICVLLFFDDERCWKNMEAHGKYGKRYGNHIKCWNNTGKDMGNGWELGEWWKHIGRIWWTLPWTCLDNQSCRIAFSWHCISFINRAIPPYMFSKDIYIHTIYIYTLYIYIYMYTIYIYTIIHDIYIYTHYIYIHAIYIYVHYIYIHNYTRHIYICIHAIYMCIYIHYIYTHSIHIHYIYIHTITHYIYIYTHTYLYIYCMYVGWDNWPAIAGQVNVTDWRKNFSDWDCVFLSGSETLR